MGNQILLRYLSPTLLGVAVQLELLSVTVLYFARESLRVALQRQQEPGETTSGGEGDQAAIKQQSQSTINLSHLAICFGSIIAPATALWYLSYAKSEVLQSHDFQKSFFVYGLATIIELLAEPSFLIIQQHSLYVARARSETTAAIARCISACLSAMALSRLGNVASVLPFAIGQLAYASVLFASYFSAAIPVARQYSFRLVPIRTSTKDYLFSLFPQAPLHLAATLYSQSIFKLLLTQGDALILSFLASLSDQGAFALAANYGGLLARLVFQPIEESSRNTFGRLLPASPTTQQPSTEQALSHLSPLIHFYILAALPLTTLIPSLIPLLTPYLFSSAFRTPEIAALLSTYIYYIPFMAINGILDAFVTSVATPSQLRRQSIWMALFTALFGAAAWLFLSRMQMGAQGLIWANVVNMALRIGWSGWFVSSWIRQQSKDKNAVKEFWKRCVPSPVLLALTASMVFGQRSMGVGYDMHTRDGRVDMMKVGMLASQAMMLGGLM